MNGWIKLTLDDGVDIHVNTEALVEIQGRGGRQPGSLIVVGRNKHYVREAPEDVLKLMDVRAA